MITEFSFFLLLFIFNQTVHPRSREAVLQRELNRPRADRLSLLLMYFFIGHGAILAWVMAKKLSMEGGAIFSSMIVSLSFIIFYWSLTQLLGWIRKRRKDIVFETGGVFFLLLGILPVVVTCPHKWYHSLCERFHCLRCRWAITPRALCEGESYCTPCATAP